MWMEGLWTKPANDKNYNQREQSLLPPPGRSNIDKFSLAVFRPPSFGLTSGGQGRGAQGSGIDASARWRANVSGGLLQCDGCVPGARQMWQSKSGVADAAGAVRVRRKYSRVFRPLERSPAKQSCAAFCQNLCCPDALDCPAVLK